MPVLVPQAIEAEVLEILVGRDGQQRQDEEHLSEGELAPWPGLAHGGEQVVTLPLLKELGKASRQQTKGRVESLMGVPWVCVVRWILKRVMPDWGTCPCPAPQRLASLKTGGSRGPCPHQPSQN